MADIQNKIREYCVSQNATLLEALKTMDIVSTKLLIICSDKGYYLNLISIGDIQRAILSGIDLKEKLENIQIETKVVMNSPSTLDSVKSKIIELRCEFMPVLDEYGKIEKIYFWNDLFKNDRIESNRKISLPVVIMAGGMGTRLKPISNVFPKPLTPIGNGTIVEEIMERFSSYGCSDFFMSINYKKELIKYYLNNTKFNNVKYFVESKPLGTAGSLSLLKGKIEKTFFVSNCDILIEQDLAELYDYHKNNNNEITIVAALKHIPISYGTLESGENGLLKEMKEKPELTIKINAGVYILEPHLLNMIPENKFYHITDLIEDIIKNNGRIGVFPISEKSWFDIGEWPEYVKTVKHLSDTDNFTGL